MTHPPEPPKPPPRSETPHPAAVLDAWAPRRPCHWCKRDRWWQDLHTPDHAVCVTCKPECLFLPGGRIVRATGVGSPCAGDPPPPTPEELKAAADRFRRKR